MSVSLYVKDSLSSNRWRGSSAAAGPALARHGDCQMGLFFLPSVEF